MLIVTRVYSPAQTRGSSWATLETALVKCAFCKEEIQDGALVCRYCGRKQPSAKKPVKASYIVVGVAFLLLILLIAVQCSDDEARTRLANCGGSDAGMSPSEVSTAADLACASRRP